MRWCNCAQENREKTMYNLVGFQTKLTYGEQRRVFRMIPGLEKAEFVRLGSMHRNTFINSPTLLPPTLQLKGDPRIIFAGQITGVEGYVESAASGFLAGINAACLAQENDAAAPATRNRPGGAHRPHHQRRRTPFSADERQLRTVPRVARSGKKEGETPDAG